MRLERPTRLARHVHEGAVLQVFASLAPRTVTIGRQHSNTTLPGLTQVDVARALDSYSEAVRPLLVDLTRRGVLRTARVACYTCYLLSEQGPPHVAK
jgi:hypothetical protein